MVRFGVRDTEICVCSALGLKLVIHDLVSSKSVELHNPKLHQGLSVARGISFRPVTTHLAVLSRLNGKDVISVHHPVSRETQASWYPDTVDAQSLEWTPDGRWLVLVESPSQGRKILFFAPDGNLFRSWTGSSSASSDDNHIGELGAGVKYTCMGLDLLCVCDHTRRLTIMNTTTGSEIIGLVHPACITPRDTLQVWQEQLITHPTSGSTHTFIRATQILSPPPTQTLKGPGAEIAEGVSMASFDLSATLLASQLEDSNSALWIWDVKKVELRAVLLFHAAINAFHWHPRIKELLMVTCAGDVHKDVVFVWDPLSDGPRCIDLGAHLSGDKGAAAKLQSSWLSPGVGNAALMVGDSSQFALVSLAGPTEPPPSWAEDILQASSSNQSSLGVENIQDADGGDGTLRIDDTFAYKRT